VNLSRAALDGVKRLRARWFNLLQTAVAAGLAWYVTHDLLRHPQPFFAPIAAVVCLSITNVLRAQRAVQMMIGVTLGIGLGTVVEWCLGPGAISIAVAALFALCVAVLIGTGFIAEGMMFANQTVVSSILVIALYRSGVGFERVLDALVGGVLAIVFAVLLFPADPLQVLRGARVGVLAVLHHVLARTADVAAGRSEAAPEWPLSAVDRVHAQLGGLIEARTTARQAVRIAPRRWGMREAVRAADHQAVHVALLAGSVLQLARAVSAPAEPPVPTVLVELAAATALAEYDPAGASAYIGAARHCASELRSGANERTQVVLADAVQACVDDVQRVIDLRPV
jgi:uncharacterized membrane protein YgaE (UPF0421/DUF939 family)